MIFIAAFPSLNNTEDEYKNIAKDILKMIPIHNNRITEALICDT